MATNNTNVEMTKQDEESLEDLVSNFKEQIKNSKWLTENTAEKWQKENQVLSEQFKNAVVDTKKDGSDIKVEINDEQTIEFANNTSELENMLRNLSKELHSSTWLEDQKHITKVGDLK